MSSTKRLCVGCFARACAVCKKMKIYLLPSNLSQTAWLSWNWGKFLLERKNCLPFRKGRWLCDEVFWRWPWVDCGTKDSKSLCSTTWNSVPYLRKLVMSRIFLYFLFQRPLSPNFLSGKRYTRKKITCVAKGRLLQKTWHILSYYLSTIIPWKTLQKSIFSMKPESRSPELALVYMVTLQWKPTVEITRKAESPNKCNFKFVDISLWSSVF